MSFEQVQSLTMTAGAVINQYRYLKMTSAGEVIQAALAGDDVIGVSMEAAAAQLDRLAMAMINGGITKIEAGAAIDVSSVPRPLTSDSVGRAIAATSPDQFHGYALESAGAAGEIIKCILVNLGGPVGSAIQRLAAPGAVSLLTRSTILSVDGTDAFSLADGLFEGQLKSLYCDVADNTPAGTLTPATFNDGATLLFNAISESAELEWHATGGWTLINLNGATLA